MQWGDRERKGGIERERGTVGRARHLGEPPGEGLVLRGDGGDQRVLHVQPHVLVAVGGGDGDLAAARHQVDGAHGPVGLVGELEHGAEGGLDVAVVVQERL